MSLTPLHNEQYLLDQMAAGDETAFVTIFYHYQDHIFNVAYQFVKTRSLAEEMVQDIFLKVWQGREKLTGLQSFQNWLFIISRNHLVSQLNRMAHEEKVRRAWTAERPLEENSTDYKIRHAQFHEFLQTAVSSLPERQQAVFRLAREKFLTYDEIARELDISPNTVRIHMSKAMETIRKVLKEKGIEYILLFAIYFQDFLKIFEYQL